MSLTLRFEQWPTGPVSVTPPDECTEIWEGDGQIFGVVNYDLTPDDRHTDLWETNAIFPVRPVDPEGVLGFLLGLIGIRIYPTGKVYTRIDKELAWWHWIVDNIGPRNAETLTRDNDGTQDLNDDSVPLNTSAFPNIYFPNPEKSLRQLACKWSGDLIKIVGYHTQGGVRFAIVEMANYYAPPTKVNGAWHYGTKVRRWWQDSWLFSFRTNRRLNGPITDQTPFGIFTVNDGGAKGGKGFEKIVTPTYNGLGALRTSDIREYPKLPFAVWMSPESYIKEGQYTRPKGGRSVVVDGMRFHMSNTFFHEKETNNWFLAEEMLIRAQEPTPGSVFDYRCYASSDGVTPYMDRNCRTPICPWTRDWSWM